MLCVGESTPKTVAMRTNEVLHITAKGRGSHCRTNLDRYGFPRGYLARQKSFFGFQTGDIVKAIVPKGKYQGTWIGTVACRKTGYFDIKNKEGFRIAQGINHKHCKILSKASGYEHAINRVDVDGIPLTTEVASILPYWT